MTQQVKVWDGFIRGYHGLLIALFAALWYTGGDVMQIDLHEQLGILLLASLITRFIWGFVGSESARFKYFLVCPIQLVRALFNRQAGPSKTYLTHNPWGGWSVILMLILLGIQAITGLFTDDAIFYQGPLAKLKWFPASVNTTLTSLHHFNFLLLQIFIGLHVLAILIYRIFGEPLVYAMIQGNKKIRHASAKEEQHIIKPKIVHGAWGYALLAVLYTVLTLILR